MSSHIRTLPPRRLIPRVLAAAMLLATLLGALALSPGAAGAATTPPKGDWRLWQLSDPGGYHVVYWRGQADFSPLNSPYWHLEGQSGRIYSLSFRYNHPAMGLVPIYSCVNTDAPAPRYFGPYVSRDPNCENPHRGNNNTVPKEGTVIFYVLPNQLAGTHPIYRCHRPEAFDWIATASATCEGRPGYVIQQILGYAFW